MRTTSLQAARARGAARVGRRQAAIQLSSFRGESRLYEEFRPNTWIADVAGAELGPDAWTNLENARISRGAAVRGPGYKYTMAGLPGTSAYKFLFTRISQVGYWIAAGTTIHVHNGAQWFDISGAWLTARPWEIRLSHLNGVPVLSAPDSAPFYWSGDVAVPCAALPGWFAAGVTDRVVAFRAFLFALSPTIDAVRLENQVSWSDAAPPGSIPGEWVPSPTNFAGDVNLSGSGGALVDAYPLRDALVIYAREACWQLGFTGGQYVFSSRKIFSNIGALAPKCVAEVNGKHIVLTEGDLIMHDGAQAQSIIDYKLRGWLFNRLDLTGEALPEMTYDKRTDTVWINYPTTDGVDVLQESLFYDVQSGEFGTAEFTPEVRGAAYGYDVEETPDQSWDSSVDPWDINQEPWEPSGQGSAVVIAGQPGGLIHSYVAGFDQGGVPRFSSASRTGLDFNAPSRDKHISHVIPQIQAEGGTEFTIRIGGQETHNGLINWGPLTPYTVGVDDELPLKAHGIYIAIEIASSGANGWRVRGVDFRYVLGGLA